jgi:hypothetical protein
MFENLGHGTIKRRPDEDASFGLDADDVEKETATPLPLLGEPSVNDLTKSPTRRRLSPDEERHLIVAAQSGDDSAMRKLIDHHVGWIKRVAKNRWFRSLWKLDQKATIDDLVGVGVAEFAQRVLTCKPQYALNTHCRKAVIGALADAVYVHRNVPGLGGVESRIQRFLRTHPGLDVEAIREKFPNLTDAEINREIADYVNLGIRPSKKSQLAGHGDSYSESGTGDDDGDYDQNGNFKSSGETKVDLDLPLLPISEWTRSASHHDKRDRYFSDGWWSKWNPPAPHTGSHISWEREDREEWLAPLLKVAHQEPQKFANDWRPQSGYVDENDYRGLGEGLSSLRSCAVKPPPKMPIGQDEKNSFWNSKYASLRHSNDFRSFDDQIAISIGAVEITTHSNDNDLEDIAA